MMMGSEESYVRGCWGDLRVLGIVKMLRFDGFCMGLRVQRMLLGFFDFVYFYVTRILVEGFLYHYNMQD